MIIELSIWVLYFINLLLYLPLCLVNNLASKWKKNKWLFELKSYEINEMKSILGPAKKGYCRFLSPSLWVGQCQYDVMGRRAWATWCSKWYSTFFLSTAFHEELWIRWMLLYCANTNWNTGQSISGRQYQHSTQHKSIKAFTSTMSAVSNSENFCLVILHSQHQQA